MNERNAINRLFEELYMERVHQVAFKNMQEDQQYKRLSNKAAGVFELLRETLTSPEQLLLLEKLEESQNVLVMVQLEYAYLQGVKDSPGLQGQLEKCGLVFAPREGYQS